MSVLCPRPRTVWSFVRRPDYAGFRRISTSDKPLAKVDAKVVDSPVPLLNRPLGVREPPSTIVKSWTDRRNELMDQEKRLAQRDHLIREAGKGYFADLNATRRHGGKTWIAPRVMIREDKALFFPNISGKSIKKRDKEKKDTTILCSGRISLIGMLSSKISEYHIQGFSQACNEAYRRHPSYQFIQINLQENLLKSFLVSLFLRSIRNTVREEDHDKYLVSSQNLEYVREPLGMTNKHVGYVYLVDENLKVRWAGCADPKEEEASALSSCVEVLLNRLDKKMQQIPGAWKQSKDATTNSLLADQCR